MSVYPGAIPPAGSASASATLAASGHTALHNNDRDEIRAIATKIGTGSSTPVANTVLRGTASGVSAFGQVALAGEVSGVLPVANGGTGQSSGTGSGLPVFQTSPTISGASLTSSPTLTTPTIADFTNSNHNHQNAAGGGTLGTSALADDAVTAAKMFYGVVRQRQGGTTGDASWYGDGASNTDTSAKNVFIQVGATLSDAAADKTVTFPVAYNQIPLVLTSTTSASGFNTGRVIIADITTTSFIFRNLDDTNTRRAERISWMAIGQ